MTSVGHGSSSDPDEIVADLLFVDPAGGPPTVHFVRPSEVDTERTQGSFAHVGVPVHNGRRLGRETSLDEEGFIFARHASECADFYEDAEVREIYYPEMEELVRCLTGAGHVVVFDHTVRGTTPGKRGTVEVELPSDMMHCDLTPGAALETLHQIFSPEELEAMRGGRIVQLNLWKPITGPLFTLPLAVCDARSIVPESCVKTKLVRPDFESEFTTLAHDSAQRWSYLPGMGTDEVIIFKNYDSDPEMSPFAVHGAFVDPNAPLDALPRESIEVRVFAVL